MLHDTSAGSLLEETWSHWLFLFYYSLFEKISYVLTKTSRFGNISLSSSDNFKFLNAKIDFIFSTKRFEEQLFEIMKVVSTERNQRNNLTSLIVWFSVSDFFSFVNVKIRKSGKDITCYNSLLKTIFLTICFYLENELFLF